MYPQISEPSLASLMGLSPFITGIRMKLLCSSFHILRSFIRGLHFQCLKRKLISSSSLRSSS